MILSTHILQEVEALCRRVLIMNSGKLIAQGTPEEIAHGLKEGVVLTVSFKGRLRGGCEESLVSLPGGPRRLRRARAGEERTEVDLAVAAEPIPPRPCMTGPSRTGARSWA